MPNLILGSVPRGQDYFGREDIVKNLWAKLEKDNILLTAPRRFGKTGLMYRLLDEPREPFRVLYINVENLNSAPDFMVDLIAALLRDRHFSRILSTAWKGAKGFGHFLRNLPSKIDLGEIKIGIREQTDVSKDWLAYGERVMSLLAKESPTPLLLIDEFAVMVNNMHKKNPDQVEKLLRWFRTARIAPDTKTRFVISGSINLVSTLDSMGLVDTINDLYTLRLEPFNPETAKQFIEAIFKSHKVDLKPDTKEAILEMVGAPIPNILAFYLNAILDRQKSLNSEVTTDLIKNAFYDDLLGGATSVDFRHYSSRISQYYPGEEEAAAMSILALLSKTQLEVGSDTLYQVYLKSCGLGHNQQTEKGFKLLMNKLENDFYVVCKEGKYAFFSRVLKLWWKTHFGFQEG